MVRKFSTMEGGMRARNSGVSFRKLAISGRGLKPHKA
jgi:hypothetical protein